MFSIGHCISHHVLKKHPQHCTNLFINKTRDSLHTSPPCQPSDSRLGDSLDVVTQHLSVTLGPSFPEPLSSFASPFLHPLPLLHKITSNFSTPKITVRKLSCRSESSNISL